MKKMFLFIIFIFVSQISYKATPVLAENKDETTAIRKVIESHLEALAHKDLNSMMSQISTNYSRADKAGNIEDYAILKSNIENALKNIINISITDLKITNLDIKGNKATLEMEYILKGVNSATAKAVNKRQKRVASLAKEGGSWKIVNLKNIKDS